MTKTLTVVIPSYNAETYIERAVKSMVSISSCLQENLEILIVNDGSKDRTEMIGEKLYNEYPDCVKVINKTNGGHGSTVNAGLKVATGKYFKVIDADDYVDTEKFEKFLVELGTYDSDLIVTPLVREYSNLNKKTVINYGLSDKIEKITYENFLEKTQTLPEMHSLTYRTSIIRDKNLKLSEKSFYVDIQYIVFPLEYIKTLTYLPYAVYQYQLGSSDQSVSIKNFVKNSMMHLKVIESIVEYQKGNNKLSSIKNKHINLLISGLVSTQINIFLAQPNAKEGYQKYIQLNRYLEINHRFSLITPYSRKAKLLKRFPKLFFPLAFLYKIQQRIK